MPNMTDVKSWMKTREKRLNKSIKHVEKSNKEIHDQYCTCNKIQNHTIYCQGCIQFSTDLTAILDRCPRCDVKVVNVKC